MRRRKRESDRRDRVRRTLELPHRLLNDFGGGSALACATPPNRRDLVFAGSAANESPSA
jgi:hypothetical protein